MKKTLLWLRAETKAREQRTLLTPAAASRLIAHGHELVVERSSQRIYGDEEYDAVGCTLVESHSWKNAPLTAVILGLKELDASDGPFTRQHVHFAHVFKEQSGWQDVLLQFKRGGGTLYDLEYLTDETGKRVAAFGYWAGYVGAAVALLAFCAKASGKSLHTLAAWNDKASLLLQVKQALQNSEARPRSLVIGAAGRCGTGAVQLLDECGLDVSAWDVQQTAAGGPFDAIREHDVLLNCVYIDKAIAPFTTLEHLDVADRRLSVLCDVSCDPFGQYNPLPVYTHCTTMTHPVHEIDFASAGVPSLSLVAIDHLPSLLPRESSDDFCKQLMPTLMQTDDLQSGPWKRARSVFDSQLARVSPETSA